MYFAFVHSALRKGETVDVYYSPIIDNIIFLMKPLVQT